MNVNLVPLQVHGDDRGSLVAIEDQRNVPFVIKRVYYLFGTQVGVSRGFHAHKDLRQMAIAVRGSCQFLLDDGTSRETLTLNDPAIGLLVEPMVWHEMHSFSEDCVLLVLASDYYDESDYIRDYNVFKKLTGAPQ